MFGLPPQAFPNPEEVSLERWIPFKQPLAHEFPVFQAPPPGTPEATEGGGR